MISFDMSNVLYSLSTALYIVEKSLLGATSCHSKRVAYICIKMGKQLSMNNFQLSSIAAAAVLHDSALTEYIHEDMGGIVDPDKIFNISKHCIIGEDNISGLPLDPIAENAVLYHHEQADGKGPFGKLSDETPISAQIIHIADQVDVAFPLKNMNKEKNDGLKKYVLDNTGTLFSPKMVQLFNEAISEQVIDRLCDETIDTMIFNECPHHVQEYPDEVLVYISKLFAKIIDYKSPFTSYHSSEIASKAKKMGEYYNLDDDMKTKLYFAGAVHDIGKLVVDNSLLDKPSKLTNSEFNAVKFHAIASYDILHSIHGLEDACEWAYTHHEKLDGTGYPFGLRANKLNKFDRLLSCLDIYQALTELRPYRKSLSHSEAINIMYTMAHQGKIDFDIASNIEKCFA